MTSHSHQCWKVELLLVFIILSGYKRGDVCRYCFLQEHAKYQLLTTCQTGICEKKAEKQNKSKRQRKQLNYLTFLVDFMTSEIVTVIYCLSLSQEIRCKSCDRLQTVNDKMSYLFSQQFFIKEGSSHTITITIRLNLLVETFILTKKTRQKEMVKIKAYTFVCNMSRCYTSSS